MEVDEAIVDVDAHLEYSSIDLFIRCINREAHALSHFTWELIYEFRDFIWLHFLTLIKHWEILPGSLKVLKIVLESLQRVVFFQVIFLELLDNDQDEEVKHHVGHKHDENYEE